MFLISNMLFAEHIHFSVAWEIRKFSWRIIEDAATNALKIGSFQRR